MRGTAPLLVVAMLSGQLIGEHRPSPPGSASPASAAACSLIGLTRSSVARAARAATPSATPSPTRAIIAAYTIVDGIGVRASGNALQYVALLFMLDGLPYFAIVMWQRRVRLADSRRLHAAALAGRARSARSASLGAYGIASGP